MITPVTWENPVCRRKKAEQTVWLSQGGDVHIRCPIFWERPSPGRVLGPLGRSAGDARGGPVSPQ